MGGGIFIGLLIYASYLGALFTPGREPPGTLLRVLAETGGETAKALVFTLSASSQPAGRCS